MAVPSPEEPTTSPHKRPMPPMAARQEPPLALEWEEPRARKSAPSRLPVVLSMLSALLAIGLGYVAYQQWAQLQRTAASLALASTQLRSLTAEHTQSTKTLSALQAENGAQKERLAQNGTDLGELNAKLAAAEAQLRELEAQSEALNERVAEFRSVTRQFQRMIDSGKLQISFRHGRMIVELPAAVLFASGSAELSDDGRKSLQEVAKILRQVPKKRFIVGGHTDDVPIAKSVNGFANNWELSAARAVTVTEALIKSGLRENHLVAAGYSEHDPIASNATDAGRQKNRRIEIVLEPELSALSGALSGLEDKKAAPLKSSPAAKKP